MQKEEYFQKMETALANHGIVSRVDRGDIVEENKYMSPGNGPGGNFSRVVGGAPVLDERTEYNGVSE